MAPRLIALTGMCAALLFGLACGDDVHADGEAADNDPADPVADNPGDDKPPPPIPDLCERYLDCVDAVRPDLYRAKARKYGPGGSCWNAGPGETAVCADACEDGLGEFHRQFQTEPACALCQRDDQCDTVAGEFCFAGGCEVVECEAGGAGSLCL